MQRRPLTTIIKPLPDKAILGLKVMHLDTRHAVDIAMAHGDIDRAEHLLDSYIATAQLVFKRGARVQAQARLRNTPRGVA